MAARKKDKPLEAQEVEITVPRGTAKKVRIKEAPAQGRKARIVVRVSKKEEAGPVPLVGVIVK